MGTMRCHYRHRFHDDRSSFPACRTSPRTWTSPRWRARPRSADADVLGFTTQAYFLISCGLAVLVSAGDPTVTLSRLKGTSAVHRLINPAEMGELFKVLAIGKGFADPLLGLRSARHLTL
jgi:SAM-dependent MidA family methyltransferase